MNTQELLLQKAQKHLGNARKMFAINLYEEAGRAAYLCGYCAARAFLFARSGKIFKTHRGVSAEFSRLIHEDPHVDRELQAFLGNAYRLKEIADYEEGEGVEISSDRAQTTMEQAQKFLAYCSEAIKSRPKI